MLEKVTPVRTYVIVAAALLVLTAGTIGVSFIPLGPFHLVAALTFAVAKALLVAMFFMHARYSGPLTKLVIVVALFWLAILVVGTMDDYLTRAWLAPSGQ
ncbi:MAG TPA: cytochrome C oxidase subunit IV family protein [Anaerolineae bacterium]